MGLRSGLIHLFDALSAPELGVAYCPELTTGLPQLSYEAGSLYIPRAEGCRSMGQCALAALRESNEGSNGQAPK